MNLNKSFPRPRSSQVQHVAQAITLANLTQDDYGAQLLSQQGGGARGGRPTSEGTLHNCLNEDSNIRHYLGSNCGVNISFHKAVKLFSCNWVNLQLENIRKKSKCKYIVVGTMTLLLFQYTYYRTNTCHSTWNWNSKHGCRSISIALRAKLS